MTAEQFKRLHLDPLNALAREQGLYFAVVIVEPKWTRTSGRVKSRAVRLEAGPDLEGVDMLKDAIHDHLLDALREL